MIDNYNIKDESVYRAGLNFEKAERELRDTITSRIKAVFEKTDVKHIVLCPENAAVLYRDECDPNNNEKAKSILFSKRYDIIVVQGDNDWKYTLDELDTHMLLWLFSQFENSIDE